MERDSGVFYKSFYDAIKELPIEDQAKTYDAIMQYMFYGLIPDGLEGVAKGLFIMAKPQIDANNNRFENGKRGGRPKQKPQTITKPKPNHNQTITKPEPNVNVNVNVNDNVNDIKKHIVANALDDSIKSYSDNKDLQIALSAFVDMRKKLKKPLSEHALKLQFTKLNKLATSDEDKLEIVNNSVAGSWQGLYALQERNGHYGESKQSTGQNNKPTTDWGLSVTRL